MNSKTISRKTVTLAYEITYSENDSAYGLRAYFTDVAAPNTSAISTPSVVSSPSFVEIPNVTDSKSEIEAYLDKLISLRALPSDLGDILDDLRL